MMQPTVVISLDLELSWGSFDHAFGNDLIEMARWTHEVGVPRLLDDLTRNRLSATWAIVGAMMRERLPDLAHLPEVRYPHFPKPWFTYVPRDGNATRNPEWFGPSLVRSIQQASPKQEIGFHSFSHVLFGVPGISHERAVAEFDECLRIAQELGFRADSFVFPRNSIGFLDELRRATFVCYRDLDRLPIQLSNLKLRSALGILADFIGTAPRTVQPFMNLGLVAIPGSMMIRYLGGWRRLIPDSSRLRRLRKGLKLVQRQGGVFHVWFHPENLYASRPRLENVIARFLDELGILVRSGAVRCVTMGELAREYLAAASIQPDGVLDGVYDHAHRSA